MTKRYRNSFTIHCSHISLFPQNKTIPFSKIPTGLSLTEALNAGEV